MLQATLSPIATTTKTAPAPTTPTSTITPLLFALDPQFLFTKSAPAPVDTAFACSNNVCYAMGDVDFLFRTLQGLINNGSRKLRTMGLPAGADIVVDGRIDARTLNAHLPISRAAGGTLAIFDFTPDPKWLASNARNIALGIATWLGLTWVAEAPGVPGHWERLRAGQTPQLPPPPPKAESDKSLAPVQPAPTPTAPTPTPTVQPTPPPPPPMMVMYVCSDGSRVSSPEACPKPQAPPVQPQPQPSRVDVGPTTVGPAVQPPSFQPVIQPPPFPGSMAPPTSRRYAGCIARFNKTRKVYSIYCPIGSTASISPGFGISDEGFRCLYGDCNQQLGADAVTPPVPAGFNPTPVVVTTALPGEGETSAGEERDKFFRVNNPAMWILFAGTAAAIGGGGYYLVRRRRKRAA